jgi:hypothetical protein
VLSKCLPSSLLLLGGSRRGGTHGKSLGHWEHDPQRDCGTPKNFLFLCFLGHAEIYYSDFYQCGKKKTCDNQLRQEG